MFQSKIWCLYTNQKGFGAPFSVGDVMEIDVIDDDNFTFEEAENNDSYVEPSSASSMGRHVSTRASSAFTNNSTFSALQFAFVKGPAKRQSPPKPQL